MMPRYVETALSEELRRVEGAADGARNETLNAAAFALGGLVGAGALDREQVAADLLRAACAAGLGQHEAESTITSGLASGARHPRRLPDRVQAEVNAPPVVEPEAPEAGPDLTAQARAYYSAPAATGKRAELAALLGVEVDVLERLRVGWRPSGERTLAGGWTWPERDAAGRVLGVQVRLPAGEERRFEQVKGGKIGLYYPADLPERPDVLVVCEGGSDCAAALGLGLPAVGLHAAGAGVNLLVDLVRRVRPGRVLVLGDDDPAGRSSAEKVQKALEAAGVPAAMAFPPAGHKDARSAIQAGAWTREHLLELGAREARGPFADHHGLEIIEAPALACKVFPPLRWAIPGIVPAGLVVLAGPPKCGKSWMSLAWACQVAAGGGEALVLALEDTERRLQGRLGILETAPAGLHLTTRFPRLGDGGAEALGDWLAAHPRCRLAVVDTWGRLRPARRENMADPYQAEVDSVGRIQAVAQAHDCAILLTHHTRKLGAQGAESEDYVESLLGSTGLGGSADGVLVLRRARGEADGVLKLTGRDVVESELAVRFQGGRWEILGEAKDYALTGERRAIVEALAGAGGAPMKASEVADACGMRLENVRRTLSRMTEAGQVSRGLRGSYRLLDGPDRTQLSDRSDRSETHLLSDCPEGIGIGLSDRAPARPVRFLPGMGTEESAESDRSDRSDSYTTDDPGDLDEEVPL